MKRIYIYLLAAIATTASLTVEAQCWNDLNYQNQYNVPSNQNDINTVNNQSGDKLFYFNGNGTTKDLPLGINFNFANLGLQGNIKVLPPVNINSGGNVSRIDIKPNSNITFNTIGFGGNSTDTGIIYVGQNSKAYLTIINTTPNNNFANKIIYLGTGAKVFINGVEYTDSNYYYGFNNIPGNPNSITNALVILRCNNVPLPNFAYEFYVSNNTLIAKLEKSVEFDLEYSTNSKVWSYVQTYEAKEMKYNLTEEGFYRIKFHENDYSKVVPFRKGEKVNYTIYDLWGRVVNEKDLKPHTIYIQNQSKFEIVEK